MLWEKLWAYTFCCALNRWSSFPPQINLNHLVSRQNRISPWRKQSSWPPRRTVSCLLLWWWLQSGLSTCQHSLYWLGVILYYSKLYFPNCIFQTVFFLTAFFEVHPAYAFSKLCEFIQHGVQVESTLKHRKRKLSFCFCLFVFCQGS